ncbi:MAG: T9SS type A sorting domain-containing protein [Bacteroidetes bacterium]|nr:T9SS type A sorting domain-containing protein [Bacteroidota bacterium]
MKKMLYFASLLTIGFGSQAQIRILFDATKAETAGNADWVIDADNHNLDWNPGAIVGGGNESNAQKIPTPAQSGITSSTSETYWSGSLSSWGVALAKLGYSVETLPYNGQITYGNTSNTQDLSHYKVFIVDEPNILFSASEKTAIINFVSNGGGLFIISDHDVSDRNGDGNDSPHIWNDLMSNNTVATNPFGFTFDYQNYVETTSNFANIPGDSILHGSQGNPTQMKISNGTTMTLSTSINPSVKPLVYKVGASNTGYSNVYMCRARYGTGKVVSLGDSSPPDDGTGDPNDNLYNGWSGEVSGDHARIIMNATIWLAMPNPVTTGVQSLSENTDALLVYPNPAKEKLHMILDKADAALPMRIYDTMGREVYKGLMTAEGIDLHGFEKGMYYYQVQTSALAAQSGKFVVE